MNTKPFGMDIDAHWDEWGIRDLSEEMDGLAHGEQGSVGLSAEALGWVASVCSEIEDEDEDEDKQWQAFLRAMAIAGVEEWLSQSALDLPLTYTPDQVPGVGVNAQVGRYRICILPTGPSGDDRVIIPSTTILNRAGKGFNPEDPNIAHLYFLVEVHEEYDHVLVRSGLRQSQLQQYLHQQYGEEGHRPEVELGIDAGANQASEYIIPVAEFTVTPDQVLLYFNTLEPEAMMVSTAVRAVKGLEGMGVARSPQTSLALEETTERLRNTVTRTTYAVTNAITDAIDVGRWLSGQTDEWATQLGWQLIPSLVPSQGFLPVRNELEAVIDQLERQGAVLPPQARGRMNDIEIGSGRCRLYAWVWPLPTEEWADSAIPEWSLFVLLGPTPEDPIPQNLELVVQDEQQVVVRSTGQEGGSYLYAQAIGSLDERFWVRIEAPGGATVELLPFQCSLG